MRWTVALVAACATSDEADDTTDTDTTHTHSDTDPPFVSTTMVEYDSQGVACLSGQTTDAFGPSETLLVTVDFGCVDGCNVVEWETRCSMSLLYSFLSVQSHGHVSYEDVTTTGCTEPCLPLVATCNYASGLAEGAWTLSYSAVVVPFDVPSAVAVCAADTDDT